MKKIIKNTLKKVLRTKYKKYRNFYINKRNCITKSKKLKKIKNNKFIGYLPTMSDSKITFNGKNNILYCEEGVNLYNSNIVFAGDNSLIYLSKSKHKYITCISIHNNSVCYFGKDNYINSELKLIISEEKNVFIGNNCLFSTNIIFRNADAHLIYDIKTSKRINLTKSIYIGDHVWISQNVTLLKGTIVGSGSIIAASSTISNKLIPSNEIWGGSPCKMLKSNIFWDEKCVHKWTKKETEKHLIYNNSDYIYKANKSNQFDKLENKFNKLTTANEKLDYLILSNKKTSKNRFSIK